MIAIRGSVMARAIALAGVVVWGIAGGRAHADERMVGDWLVQSQEDKFGDGGTYIAVVPSQAGLGFAVRCIRKQWSLAFVDLSSDPKPLTVGDTFAFKMKVDREPVVELTGHDGTNSYQATTGSFNSFQATFVM
jgi:hypothetical protein